jgi:hypothetical protein
MEDKPFRVQAVLTGDSAKIFASEQKSYDESQSVTLRRIIKSFKKMKDNGCKPE